MLNKLSLILLGIAVFSLIGVVYEIYIRFNPDNLSFSAIPKNSVSVVSRSALPTKISLPDLEINLPVIAVEIKNNRWPDTLSGVSYLSSSAIPGEVGNSIFYGHDFPRLLGSLYKAKPGQSILVDVSGGARYKYVVEKIINISPNDVSILLPSDQKQLTLYTCTGFLDTRRLAVIAYLQK